MEDSHALPPAAQVIQLLSGSAVSQAVYVAAKLGVADRLADGPVPIEVLARDVGADAGALERLLRLLVSLGVFRRAPGGGFANTPLSDTLRSGPDTLRDLAIWWEEEPHWRVYGHLLDAVRTGQPVWSEVHGQGLFAYLARTNPELEAVFQRAMTSYSSTIIPAVLAAYDFSRFGVIADVGGGYGRLLAAILEATPAARGLLLDQPTAVAGAPELLERQGVASRALVVEADCFESIPFAADAYVLNHILHAWPDAACLRLLRGLRAAMPPHARVLILELLVPESDAPHFSKVCDLDMLVSVGGKERTAAEFAALLEPAGLRIERIVPTASAFSIVEAVATPESDQIV